MSRHLTFPVLLPFAFLGTLALIWQVETNGSTLAALVLYELLVNGLQSSIAHLIHSTYLIRNRVIDSWHIFLTFVGIHFYATVANLLSSPSVSMVGSAAVFLWGHLAFLMLVFAIVWLVISYVRGK